jgi:hypothetical protein
MHGDCGIVLDKNKRPEKTKWEVTQVGPLAELQKVTEHDDTIFTYLDKSSYREKQMGTLKLKNTVTGQQNEPATIYEFEPVV